MAAPPYDFAILGSTPLSCLLAGLLASQHGRKVCLVATAWSSFHLLRHFDLSVMAATRPETWDLLRRGSAETLKLLGAIGKGLYERVDPLFIGEAPATMDMLAHLRHVAIGMGFAAERVTDRALIASGTGCRIRDAALLVPGRVEPALAAWLDGLGVPRLANRGASVELRRDGSALLAADTLHYEATNTILADDDAILRHLASDQLDTALRLQTVASVLTEPAKPIAAPLMHYLDRGVTLGQRAGRGPITAIAAGTGDLLPRIGSCLAAQTPLLRSGQTSFRALATTDGAPLVGTTRGVRATLIAGLGPGAAFLAPALARFIAGVASEDEQQYFAARSSARGNSRRLVADWTDAPQAEQKP